MAWQRNLSLSYEKIGDVEFDQGQLSQALESYLADLAIAESLAKSDASNAGWQRDLSVSYGKVGGVEVAQGELAQALEILSSSIRYKRPSRQVRSGQRGLAAQSFSLLRGGRQR